MNSPIEQTGPGRKKRGLVLVLVLLVILGGGWFLWQKREQQTADFQAAMVANARGIAYLERYDLVEENGKTAFDNATEQFAEAMRLRPDWITPQINYGMSLLYTGQTEKLDQAIAVFEKTLRKEPQNPYANHCLGIIYFFRGDAVSANRYFKVVTEVDPEDAYAWYFRGFTIENREESEEALECFQKAVKLDPYLTTARFSLAGHISINDPKVRAQMHEERSALRDAFWERTADTKPSKLGRYGTPIGLTANEVDLSSSDPTLSFDQKNSIEISLGPNTSWATEVDEATQEFRKRFGGVLVRLDFDNDDRPDLLLLSSVNRDGKLGDLLLRNEGNGRFTDVTVKVGLGTQASRGAAVGDFDNSGFSDLILTTEQGVRLLRNQDGKTFEDVTAQAGFDGLNGRFLASAWVDLDQDGDLDLLLTKPESQAGKRDGQLLVYKNIGEAPPAKPNEQAGPLTVNFERLNHPAFDIKGSVVGLITVDAENDGDVDVIVLADGEAPIFILNDRLLRFHRGAANITGTEPRNGGLVFDANQDDQSDLLFLSPTQAPEILRSKVDTQGIEISDRFEEIATELPPLKHAQAIDMNHDGIIDIVGTSDSEGVVLAKAQRSGNWELVSHETSRTKLAILAAASCDVDGDCHNDLLVWTTEGLNLYRNLGNQNRGLSVKLSGKREKEAARTNQDAIGTKVTSYTGSIRTMIENTTMNAGPGQSLLPLDFGIGKAMKANALRIAWPDVVPQAEVDLASCEKRQIRETDRRSSSCPVLFTWDGSRFVYVTDILGAGSMGELGADGSTRPPRPEESLKIEAHQIQPKNGRYVIKLAEPMDELLYLDHVKLEVVDHPRRCTIYPDERFAVVEPFPTQKLLNFQQWISPRYAQDHRGNDVTDHLHKRDGRTVDRFRKRSWHGLAEEHFVELDFGDQLKKIPGTADVHLVLTGWTDYAYPETIYAAGQAGVTMMTPILEKQMPDGTWETVGEMGFPAGLPRVMTTPLKELAGTEVRRLRIRTNMHIYWDQIRLGIVQDTDRTSHVLNVSKATLDRRGFAKEVFPTGRSPAEYDDQQMEPVTFTRWKGKVTKLGEVTELVTGLDDRFVIVGPGDEAVIEFDAGQLPPLAEGFERSVVLRSHGYCKDAAPFTATSGLIHPLPFRAMSSYPFGAEDRTLAPAAQAEYDRVWNTRKVGYR